MAKINQKERERRWLVVYDLFKKLDRAGLPWMAATSNNDPDVIYEISQEIGERVSVYSWLDEGNWFCISDTFVSQSIEGRVDKVEIAKGGCKMPRRLGEIIIYRGVEFMLPYEIADLYLEIVEAVEVEAQGNSADSKP